MKANWLAFKKRYWDARAANERRAIVLGALVLSPLIAYLVLWQPAHVANAKLRAALPALRAQAAHLRTGVLEAETVRHLPRPAVLDAATLKTAVEESAVRHQIRSAIASLDAQQPNAVRITVISVSFEQWINWLRSLQQEQHIRVESTGVVPLPQTGMARINATLTNGGTE